MLLTASLVSLCAVSLRHALKADTALSLIRACTGSHVTCLMSCDYHVTLVELRNLILALAYVRVCTSLR